jgi:hypothetical protein
MEGWLQVRAFFVGIFLAILVMAACEATECSSPVSTVTRTCAEIGAGCVPVIPGQSGPGYEYRAEHGVYFFPSLSSENHYFLLMGDISCEKTCAVFQFEQGNPSLEGLTVFDLNGHTLTYSAGDYARIANNGFEQWSGNQPTGWTVRQGTVEKRSTSYWMPMTGDYVLYSPSAVTLESSGIDLTEDRVYTAYATIGRAAASDVTIEVLDTAGDVICQGKSTNSWLFRGQTIACQFKGQGLHRIRLKSLGYVYFDMTGIVPHNDYGIGVFTSWSLSSSNSNRNRIVDNLAPLTVPASGDHANPSRLNHLEVTNGRIIAGSENLDSVGVFLSGTTDIHLHNVEIRTQGLKSHTFRGAGKIHDNYLYAGIPWYFSRENSDEENGLFGGGEYYNNFAVGGQGVIRLQGRNPKVYNNCLRNNAQATNHYAIIHSGAQDAEIYGNIFDPIEGSGILTYVGHGYRIHDNIFNVRTAPCNVEYINEDYSTNGIRMNDYGSGDNNNNWVYNNEFNIVGSYHSTAWSSCMPVTTGIFYSASGHNNRIFNNTFRITKMNASERAPVFALYIGGDAYNGPSGNKLITQNTFETNDKAVWISTYYGPSRDIWLENNTFRRVANSYYSPESPDSAIRLGHYRNSAQGTIFVNNRFEGFSPDSYYFTANAETASYTIEKSNYLHAIVTSDGNPASGIVVRATAGNRTETGVTDDRGRIDIRLVDYIESGDMRPAGLHTRQYAGPYALSAGSESFGYVNGSEERTLTLALGTGTVMQSQCGQSDSNNDNMVSIQELNAWVASWMSGNVQLSSLIGAINDWKHGC